MSCVIKADLRPEMRVQHRHTKTIATLVADPEDPSQLYPVADWVVMVRVPGKLRARRRGWELKNIVVVG